MNCGPFVSEKLLPDNVKFPTLCILAVFGMVRMVSGATLLELDFQNVNDSTTKALTRTEGASQIGELGEGAAIETGPTGIEAGIPQIRSGAMVISKQERQGFLTMKETEKGNAWFSAYTRSNHLESGTMVVVFQPEFGGPVTGDGPLARPTLFSTQVASSRDPSMLTWDICNHGLRFLLGTPSSQVLLKQPDWNPDKWYFLVMSWAKGESPILYVRELGSSEFAMNVVETVMAKTGGKYNVPIRIGNYNGEPPSSPMNGKMAYFLWTDDYTNSADAIDTLFKQITESK